jgi:serine/threonine protein kinase
MLKPPIVHGDLKGVNNFSPLSISTCLTVTMQNNVLITRAGHAVLTDFGLSQVIEDLSGPSGNTTTTIPGTVRWQAPELVMDDENDQKLQLTFSSDVWAFACTAYEVSRGFLTNVNFDLLTCCSTQLLTGNIPYHNRLRDFSVIQDIMHGVKPGGPDAGLKRGPAPHDKIWKLLDWCWSHQPQNRPQMKEVDAELEINM